MMLSANLMTARHAMILRPDVIHTTYFMPFLVTLLLMAGIAAETLTGGAPPSSRRRVVLPVLAGIAAAFGGLYFGLSALCRAGELRELAPLLRRRSVRG